MARVDFPEYKPDLNDNVYEVSNNVTNVVPRSDGYGPFKDFVSLTASLPAPCRGYYFSRNTDGTTTIFAGTATKLYMLNNATFAWVDVSKGLGLYVSLANNAQWDFTQFENLIIATQANTVPQSFTLGVSGAFADLAGGPPNAAYVTTISGFVILSGLLSNPIRAQWCDLFNPTVWTPGMGQADFQDFPSGGIVRSIAGFDLFGILMQDAAIRLMTYAPGNPVIFQITKITDNDGILAPYMMVIAQQTLFFLSPQGFKSLSPGGFPTPMGKERVDRFFFQNADLTNTQLMLAASDPANNRLLFTFKSLTGQAGLFDTVLLYDWVINRWTKIKMTGEFLGDLQAPGAALENLDKSAPIFPGGPQIGVTASAAGATYPSQNFVGSVAAGIMTVIAQRSAMIAPGQTVTGAGVPGATTITGPGTTLGTWNLSNNFSVSSEVLTVTQPSVRLTVATLGVAGGENFYLGSPGSPNMNSVEPYYFLPPTAGLQTNEILGTAWPYQVIDSTHIDVIGPTFVANVIHDGAVAAVGGSIDLFAQSLDSIGNAALPTLAMCNSSGQIGFFTGPNLEAQVETHEVGSEDGPRMFLQGFRVISDAPTIMGSASFRDNPQQATYNYTAEASNDNLGICRHPRIDTRYSRSKVRIPYGTSWTYVRSIEPIDLDETGTR